MDASRRTFTSMEREHVWKQSFGMKAEAYCLCCRIENITFTNFHMGHIKALAKGGDNTPDNLRPICSRCNYAMSTENMLEFMYARIPYRKNIDNQFLFGFNAEKSNEQKIDYPHSKNVKPRIFSLYNLKDLSLETLQVICGDNSTNRDNLIYLINNKDEQEFMQKYLDYLKSLSISELRYIVQFEKYLKVNESLCKPLFINEIMNYMSYIELFPKEVNNGSDLSIESSSLFSSIPPSANTSPEWYSIIDNEDFVVKIEDE